MELETFSYDNRIVRKFTVATIVWGFVGMLVGLLVAFDLVFPSWSLGLPFTTFGRIRPLHTNAVIFAFVGNAIFMSAQKLPPQKAMSHPPKSVLRKVLLLTRE